MKKKEKHYFTQAVGIDKNGLEHTVVVCGVWYQHRETANFTDEVVLKDGLKGKLTYAKKVNCKSFQMGYAICAPDDKFSKEEGKKIALSRAKKKPIGVLGTLNFTMLNADQCQALIMAEAMHITKNIDSYILKKWD